MRASLSGAPFPNELRDLLQHRLGNLESQLVRKVSELEEEKSQLYNETSVHRQQTENTLNTLMNRISDLEKGIHNHLYVYCLLGPFILSFPTFYFFMQS